MPLRRARLLSIGGPLFNLAMVVVLGGISALVVYLPSRNPADAGTAASADEAIEVGLGDSPADGGGGARGDSGEGTDGGSGGGGGSGGASGGDVVGGTDTEALTDAVADAVEDAVADELSNAPIVVVERTPRLSDENDDAFGVRVATTVPRPAPSTTAPDTASPTATTTSTAAPPSAPRLPQCTDFTSREAAQALYDADRAGRRYLDGDGDGLACEQIPSSGVVAAISCANYAHQGLAQAAFDADRVGMAVLDGDGDGLACEGLPLAPGPPPPTADEVRSMTNLYALHTLEAPFYMDEVDHVARLTGHTPGSVLFFSDFARPYPAAAVDSAYDRGMIPIVGWEPIVPGSSSQPRLDDIVNGEWDAFIDTWAAAARDHGVPVVIRFAAEMNGDWYTWSESRNGNTAGSFAAAWRHLHDRFESAGASNVIWLWSVNRVDSLRTNIASFWPGDAYVDWVGTSGYLRTLPSDGIVSFDRTFGRTLVALRALTSKPILLAEIGAGTTQEAKVAWIDSLWEGLAAHPDIIGFVWFNEAKSGGDWRLQTSQQVVDAFIVGLEATPWRFGTNPPGMRTDQLLRVPAPPLPPTTTTTVPPTTTRPPVTTTVTPTTTRPPVTTTTRAPSTATTVTAAPTSSTTTAVPATTTTVRQRRRG